MISPANDKHVQGTHSVPLVAIHIHGIILGSDENSTSFAVILQWLAFLITLCSAFSDIMFHSSEQQTETVSDAQIDTLCVQETAIVDHGDTEGTVDLNDISTQTPALSGSGLLGNPHHLALLGTMHVCFII
jgi:hypothetical protein